MFLQNGMGRIRIALGRYGVMIKDKRQRLLDALHHLPGLAFGGDGRGDDHFRLVHLLDGGGTAETHCRAQGTDEVLVAMSCRGRAEEYLFQCPGSTHLYSGTPG